VSSDIGHDPHHLNNHLVGGAAIMTFGLWASKVSKSSSDSSGYGSFTTTNIQGKGMTHISFILALIAVQKGSDIGWMQISLMLNAWMTVKPYSLEWLRLQWRIDDPFIRLMEKRPNSTTLNPNRELIMF